MDWMMGQILAALEQTQRSEETITFYTSDNGHPVHNDPNGNHPLRDGKDSTWEGGFRMPGIVHWPGRVPANKTSNAIVHTMDIFPTIAALAGVRVPHDRIIDGLDMAPVLFNGSRSLHNCIMFYAQAVAADADNQLYA